MEASWWQGLSVVNLGFALMGGTMLSKSSKQFSVDGAAVFPPCTLAWDETMVQVMVVNGNLLQKDLCQHAAAPRIIVFRATAPEAGLNWTTPLPEVLDTHMQVAQSLVGSLLLSPGSCSAQGFLCVFQESVSRVLWKFCNQIPLALKVKFPGCSQSLFADRQFEKSLQRINFQNIQMKS